MTAPAFCLTRAWSKFQAAVGRVPIAIASTRLPIPCVGTARSSEFADFAAQRRKTLRSVGPDALQDLVKVKPCFLRRFRVPAVHV